MSTMFFLVMLGAWLFVGYRIHQTVGVVQRPVHFMHQFFLFMALFCACISLPYIWLAKDPSLFPTAMAWGYVVGHIFCYIAFMYIARMVFAMVPKLADKDRLVVAVWLTYAAILTVVNAKTMIWGIQPIFSYDNNLTEFRTAPVVGNAIVLLALFTIVPAIVLFVRNAIKSQGGARNKAMLLAGGFLLMMVAGPMHDVARTGTVYAAADFISMISAIILGYGVIYRLEQGMAAAPTKAVIAPSSNTV